MTWPTISLVPGCAWCAFTITGLPAAKAAAVSPPATENASGKLLAPKTATGPEPAHHRANIGPRQRLAIGLRGIDARIDPRTFFNHLRKQAKLIDGARGLAFEARFRQSGLAVGALHKLGHDGFNAVGNAAQEAGLLSAGKLAVGDKCFFGEIGGAIQIAERGAMVDRLKLRARGRIDAVKSGSSCLREL